MASRSAGTVAAMPRLAALARFFVGQGRRASLFMWFKSPPGLVRNRVRLRAPVGDSAALSLVFSVASLEKGVTFWASIFEPELSKLR